MTFKHMILYTKLTNGTPESWLDIYYQVSYNISTGKKVLISQFANLCCDRIWTL